MSETDTYNDWTVVDLKDEAKARGIPYSGLNKEQLVEALENDDENEPVEEDEEDEELEDEEDEEVEYEHAFGTCVPLAPCPHVKGKSEEVEEDTDESVEDE